MVAGEAKHPQVYLKAAFKTMHWRFAIFFISGALCVGIVIPYNNKALVSVLSGTSAGAGTAAASPYMIAMQNLGISGLPHFTNALLVTSIFSAGNALTYCATRSLYGLALEGQAPRFLRKCTKDGIPICKSTCNDSSSMLNFVDCYAITMLFPLISFLCVSSGTAQVVTWLVNLITASQIINYIVMSITYLGFYRAVHAQGIDRESLPYTGWFPTIFWLDRTCCYGHDRHLLRLYDIPSWSMGYWYFLFLLHHALALPNIVRWMEVDKEDKVR